MDFSPRKWALDLERRVEVWWGLMIFYTIQDIKDPQENFYVQKPQGLVKIQDGQNDQAEYEQVAKEWKRADRIQVKKEPRPPSLPPEESHQEGEVRR